MDALPLDPAGYSGSYKVVGGEISLDFVNTISWPETPREHDWFEPATNITPWAVAAGLIDETTSDAIERTLEQGRRSWAREAATVKGIRRDLATVLGSLARHGHPGKEAVAPLDELLRHVSHRRHLDSQSLRWSWEPPTNLVEVMAPVVWNAGEVLTQRDHSRLRHCSACDWLFYDSSRNNSRRWCDMSDCGSRDKALRYYHRQRNESL